MKLIELNIDRIIELCKKYRVRKLYVFGSVLTDRFNDNSDIDFSVDFDREQISNEKLDWADLFFDFIHGLEDALMRRVDVVVDDYVTNPHFKKELDRTKRLIYG
ncbi:MAG: nucleotidyltransferase domain-containing protein [Muribaculaceae bacterium]|nr:nucleotidyltransferase domain-containing protein [Muribaculaceae bacterium]